MLVTTMKQRIKNDKDDDWEVLLNLPENKLILRALLRTTLPHCLEKTGASEKWTTSEEIKKFIDVYDDQVETLILTRGYIDLQVQSIQGVFIFADREIRDVYGNDRGRAQGTCAHTSIGKEAYTCSINLEILADDGFVSAAFRSEGSLDFGEQVSQLTVTGGIRELESASGVLKLSTTDPATLGNAAGEDHFQHLFFEGAVFVDSSFLTSIMAEN